MSVILCISKSWVFSRFYSQYFVQLNFHHLISSKVYRSVLELLCIMCFIDIIVFVYFNGLIKFLTFIYSSHIDRQIQVSELFTVMNCLLCVKQVSSLFKLIFVLQLNEVKLVVGG